jgi:hypothetical protein
MRRTRAGAVLAALMLLGLLAACADEPTRSSIQNVNAPGATPTRTQIIRTGDYIDFVRFNGITYQASYWQTDKPTVVPGAEFARVQYSLEINLDGKDWQRDGAAAYLDVGQPVYAVKGYDPRYRLTAKDYEGNWRLYEADTNPAAKTGADLMDIGGKVKYIGINSWEDHKVEITAIKDAATVNKLVEQVLKSPVDQNIMPADAGENMRLVFYLQDGTQAGTYLMVAPNGQWLLGRGIKVPTEFAATLQGAVRALSPTQVAALTPTPKVKPGATVNLAKTLNLSAANAIRVKMSNPQGDPETSDRMKIDAAVATLNTELTVVANPPRLVLDDSGRTIVIQFKFDGDPIVVPFIYDRLTGLLELYANEEWNRITVKAPPTLLSLLGLDKLPSPAPPTVAPVSSFTPPPPRVTTVAPPPTPTVKVDADTTVNMHSRVANPEAGERFFTAYNAGQTAKWEYIVYTQEGDPIFHRLNYAGKGKEVTMLYDNTLDKFAGQGDRRVQQLTCKSMVRDAQNIILSQCSEVGSNKTVEEFAMPNF